MDFIKTEERLIRTQLVLQSDIKQLEMLSKLDSVAMKIESQLPEIIPVTIKTAESLSKNSKFTLPLKVVGKMLGVGRHKNKYYKEEDLKWSVNFHKGRKIPIKVDHRHLEVGSLIGAIDKIYWDDAEKVVRYEGHINDGTQARNVLDGMVTEVSATIMAAEERDAIFGLVGKYPEYTELSLVIGGSFQDNTIEPVV